MYDLRPELSVEEASARLGLPVDAPASELQGAFQRAIKTARGTAEHVSPDRYRDILDAYRRLRQRFPEAPEDRRFEDYNMVMEACIHGVGIALARPPLSDAALQSGRVVAVAERCVDHHIAFHLIRPEDAPLRWPAVEVARRLLSVAGHNEATIAGFTAPSRGKISLGQSMAAIFPN